MPTPAQNMFSTDISRLTVAVSRLTQTLERGARGGGGGVMAGALAGGLAGRVGGVMAGASTIAQVAATASPAAPGGLAAQAAATQQMARAVAEMGSASSKAARSSQEHAENLKKQVVAYGLLSGAILSWTRAGLAGTTAGERLALNFQMISREIAQLFLPAIERVLHFMEDVIARFRELSGEQQAAIGRWLGIGTAVLGVMVVLPKLVAGFQALRMVLTSLAVGNPFGAIVTVVGLILASSKEAREGFGTLLSSLGRLAGTLGTTLAPLFQLMTRELEKWGPALARAMEAIAWVVDKISQGVGLLGRLPGSAAPGRPGAGGQAQEEEPFWRESLRITPFFAGINRIRRWNRRRSGMDEEGDWMGQGEAAANRDRNQLVLARSGFEEVTSAFRRIQETALRTDYQRQMAEDTSDIRQNVSEIARRMATGAAEGIQIRQPPPVGP